MAKKTTSRRPKRYDPNAVRFINPAQLAGIETSVLDDGPGRGVRIAWVNTGSLLRYKVLIDRGLDIADAFHGHLSLAWLSLTGTTPPNRALDGGLDWLRGFYGGLVCSCGPQHVGGPKEVDGVEFGLHDRHSNTPAAIESIVQPDPAKGEDRMSITGVVRTARVFGPNIELRRTISSTLGEPVIDIHDEFLNRGNTAARHCWLLHINLGWPLLDAGSRLVYRGKVTPRSDSVKWFADPEKAKICRPPVKAHCGTGEDCAFIDPVTDDAGLCHAGLVNERIGLGVEIAFPKRQYKRLVNWQHFGPGGEYVTGLEPISGGMDECGVPAGKLAPGETRAYDCRITVLDRPAAIRRFVKRWG